MSKQKDAYNIKDLGKRIKIERMKPKITQAELAEELYISEEMISKIERGQCRCMPEYLIYFCKRFKKSMDYFYFGEKEGYFYHSALTKREQIKEIEQILENIPENQLMQIYQIIKILV